MVIERASGRPSDEAPREAEEVVQGLERPPRSALPERFAIERNRSIDQNSLERESAGALSDRIG